ARAPEEMASRVPLAHAAILENVDLLAGAPTDVPARETGDGPAHRHVGASGVEEMLLGLVGSDEHHTPLGEWSFASGLDTEEALERVDACSRPAPVVLRFPFELRLHRLRHAIAVGEAELRQHGSRRGEAEVLDEVLSEESHRDRIEKESALSGEADQPAFGVELEELLVVEIFSAQCRPLFRIEGEGTSF